MWRTSGVIDAGTDGNRRDGRLSFVLLPKLFHTPMPFVDTPTASPSTGDALTEPIDVVVPGRRSIVPITALRGIAALLVVWDHWCGVWLTSNNMTWWPATKVDNWIVTPLAITQNFGFLGVSIFFLISGFIITHVAQRESRFEFAVKRVFRIYPPLIAATLLVLLVEFGLRPAFGLQATLADVSVSETLRAISLVNWVWDDQAPIVGTAWTLIIEMGFYALCMALLPLVARRPNIALGAGLGLIAFVDLTRHRFPNDALVDNYFLFAVSMSYLPLLYLGQARYYHWAGRMTLRATSLWSIAAVLLFFHSTYAIYPQFMQPSDSYPVSIAFAYVIFSVALGLGDRMPNPGWLNWTSKVSYSLYLIHAPVGFLVFDSVARSASFSVAIVVATAATALTCLAMWHLAEQPGQRAARWILRGRRSQRPT